VKIAALAPMPSASVITTVAASPLDRPSDRIANLKSFRKVIITPIPLFDYPSEVALVMQSRFR
jgi:hypothetical protein